MVYLEALYFLFMAVAVVFKLAFKFFYYLILRPLNALAWHTSGLIVYAGTILGILGLMAYGGTFDNTYPILHTIFAPHLPISLALQDATNNVLAFVSSHLQFLPENALIVIRCGFMYWMCICGFVIFGYISSCAIASK